MSRYLFIALLFSHLFNSVSAQFSPSISFQNEIDKIAFSEKSYCLLIHGNNEALLDYIHENKIILKYIQKEWIAITISGIELVELIKLPAITDVYWDNSLGFVLNDQMLSNANVIGLQEIGIYDSLLNGENVIIGFIDAGVDYSHEDFINDDNSSRILYFWDQKMPEDSSAIFEEYGYGKLISQDTLNDWIASDIQIPLDPNAYFGHGSTVVGSACANGRALASQIETGELEVDFHGVAPKSSIIMVASDFNRENWLTSIADGIHFMLAKAEELNMPIVINLSVGSYSGSHDALDPVGIIINDWFDDDHPGRSAVCAGGNSRSLRYHLGYDSNADTSFSVFSSFDGAPEFQRMTFYEVWLDSINNESFSTSIGIYDEANTDFLINTSFDLVEDNLGTTLLDTLWSEDSTLIGIVKRSMESRGDQIQFQVQVEQLANNNYQSVLYTLGEGRVDTWSAQWIGSSDIIGPEALPNLITDNENYQGPDSLMQIVSSFSCAENLITVANYKNRVSYTDVNNNVQNLSGEAGELATHSSRGPTRDGRIKPDIAASGELILTTGPYNYLEILLAAAPHKVALGGKHMRNGGTSMASPIVAGIAALYLQRCPYSTSSQIKNALLGSAYQDVFTGILPNISWGNGKVNGLGALQFSLEEIQVTEVMEECGEATFSLSVLGNYYDLSWNTGDTTSVICVSDGEYWVSGVDDQGCIQRSEIIVITPDGIEKLDKKTITIFPNPTSGKFTLNDANHIGNFQIINVLGQKQAFISEVRGEKTDVELLNAESGVYFLIDEQTGSNLKFIISK